MRYLNMLLGLLMLVCAALQYNDPDALLWIVYYIVPAAWAFLVAFRLDIVRTTLGKRLLWASAAVWLGLVIYYWPQMPGFWQREVFWAEETVREGVGLMIAWLAVMVAIVTAREKRPP